MPPRIIDHLDDLITDHDLFVVDQWGVLHDGVRPHPGAIEALQELKARGTVVLVSNTSRRVDDNRAALRAIGFEDHLWDGIITAGGATLSALLHDQPGARVRCIGDGEPPDHPLRDLAPRLTCVEGIGHATALAVVGVSVHPPDHQDDLLIEAIERDLPLYCFNPDIRSVQPDGSFLYCPGAIAARYEALGGTSLRFGKPRAELYAQAAAMAPSWTRGLGIGDSLHHDIQGAINGGMDSILITRGVHWDQLCDRPGDRPDPAKLAALCEETGIWPTAAMGTLQWSAS